MKYKGREAEYMREWNQNNKEKKSLYHKNHVVKDPEAHAERQRINSRKYIAKNREKKREYEKKYRLKYPERIAHAAAKRRAAKKNAIPKWADMEKIKEIYRNRPEGYEVDHVIPLQGRIVCGLHCEDNMQYLTKINNQRKHAQLIGA